MAQPFFLNCVTGCNKKLANELILLNRQITPSTSCRQDADNKMPLHKAVN